MAIVYYQYQNLIFNNVGSSTFQLTELPFVFDVFWVQLFHLYVNIHYLG
jgi:predicted solute-binding protein